MHTSHVVMRLQVIGWCTVLLQLGPGFVQQPGSLSPVPVGMRQKLKAASTKELLDLLTEDSIEVGLRRGVSANFPATVAAELIRRRPYQDLLHALTKSDDLTQLKWVAMIIGKIRSPSSDSAMRVLATTVPTPAAMFALRYFGEVNQTWALRVLLDNYSKYKVWVEYRQDLLRLFRDERYAPAVPLLIDEIDEGNATTSGLAVEGLRAIFPAAPTGYLTQEFWRKYASQHHHDP